jgi:ATP-binding cassette subfamily B protein
VAAGEKLAIVGRTGAGKSTIAKLISRAYEFQSGSLLVDGRDIRSYSLDALRGAIGLVSQDPFLFSGTVADNIRYGLPGAPDSRIEEAARSLGRGDWVDDLPSGLATETGHRGSSLSMGQRQLVVLARVLLRDPRIFILDEATSSVDPFTEAQIQEGLEAVMSGRTAIVIAHRLSTVKSADRIVVLDKGRILEEGSHESLLDRGGNYAELYRSYFRHQSLEYIETAPAAAGA